MRGTCMTSMILWAVAENANATRFYEVFGFFFDGAGAVVLENVPPYAIVVGVPAKIKRFRYPPKVIETLQRVKWWEWSLEDLNKNAEALLPPELFVKTFGHPIKEE